MNTHVGFIVVKVLSVGDPNTSNGFFTLKNLEDLAAKSGGTMWVIDNDLLTHQPLESNNKIKHDA